LRATDDLHEVLSGGSSLVPIVKSTDFGERHHATFRRCLDASWRGRVLLEGEMGSRPMIIGDVSSKHATQMPLAENDDVIQTLAAQGSDQEGCLASHNAAHRYHVHAGGWRESACDSEAGRMDVDADVGAIRPRARRGIATRGASGSDLHRRFSGITKRITQRFGHFRRLAASR
jgi:hypothetical protein